MTWHRRIFIPVFFFLICLALGAMKAWSAGTPAPATKSVVTTILSKKARKQPVSRETGNPPFFRGVSILTRGGRFFVIPSTRVFSQLGKEIGMEKLPVPCKARLWYEPLPNNNPNVVRIEILQVLPGASTAWALPQPQ